MAQKLLNISQPLLNFDGIPVTDNDITIDLRIMLIRYILFSSKMGLSEEDQLILYGVGFIIGKATSSVSLSSQEYDALKRMTDKGKTVNQQGVDDTPWTNLVRFQVKEMVDTAPVAKEEEESHT